MPDPGWRVPDPLVGGRLRRWGQRLRCDAVPTFRRADRGSTTGPHNDSLVAGSARQTQNSLSSGSAIVTQCTGPMLRKPSWRRRAPSTSSRATTASTSSLTTSMCMRFLPFLASLNSGSVELGNSARRAVQGILERLTVDASPRRCGYGRAVLRLLVRQERFLVRQTCPSTNP